MEARQKGLSVDEPGAIVMTDPAEIARFLAETAKRSKSES